MTVSDDVAGFLRKNRPTRYCDGCIAEMLVKNRHQIQSITQSLSTTSAFDRSPGGCAECQHSKEMAIRDSRKMAIRAN